MRAWLVLLVACIVIAYQAHTSDAQFSFSLPGKWGNGKRAALGWGKRGECGDFDPDAIFNVYRAIQAEALRINECMQQKLEEESKKH
uniref:Adipokinetic hormone 1 neuropeptide 1 n=1 Tax=Platynereis dumerilii TaxID=6359 RepID=V5TDZ8_PLADU|nr:adipokinetic hormone 1 neuropeptide precursor 1 [Platynereis dumerilii]